MSTRSLRAALLAFPILIMVSCSGPSADDSQPDRTVHPVRETCDGLFLDSGIKGKEAKKLNAEANVSVSTKPKEIARALMTGDTPPDLCSLVDEKDDPLFRVFVEWVRRGPQGRNDDQGDVIYTPGRDFPGGVLASCELASVEGRSADSSWIRFSMHDYLSLKEDTRRELLFSAAGEVLSHLKCANDPDVSRYDLYKKPKRRVT